MRDFRPSLLGKVNTLVQIVGLTVILAEKVLGAGSPELDMVRMGLLKGIALLAPVSAAQYAWIVIRRISGPAQAGAEG